ncbi:MAG: sigma-70 family RNA polymerase sigma factor [Candidatus Eremiobacteraeota bacterium]|nr:sigma-70 family RNA polymerase sigma factor [Candidatus Eremiobacteraeota bacterium]
MPDARTMEEASASLLFLNGNLDVPHARPTNARRAAEDELVAKHHYLCRRGARKFWRCGLERCDLEQVAALGLIKAARRYDAASGTPFEAYAWILIVGELMHHVRDHERPVRLPRRLQSLERAFDRTYDVLSSHLGREPSDVELAHALRVSSSTVVELRRARNAALPAELEELAGAACDEPDTLSLEDRLVVTDAFAALDQVARRIIVGRYLLGLTQLQLGRHLGLSPKRVSRLHHAALADMQRAWAS